MSNRSGSGVFNMGSQLDAIVDGLVGTELRPKRLTSEDMSKLNAKAEFRDKLLRLGLSKRAAGRLFKKTEGCVRAWTKDDDLSRNPPQYAVDILDEMLKTRRNQFAVALRAGGAR